MSGGGGASLGVPAPGVQEDAVLREPVRHVLQPQQAAGGLGPLAPEWHQPGVLAGGRQSAAVAAAAAASSSAAAAAPAAPVLDIKTSASRKRDDCE